MQIRCSKCHIPVALNRDAVVDALDHIDKEKLSFYDLRCPKCRTMNRVSRKQLQRSMPKIARDPDDAS
jgi:phage FluMu protein Com